jgi:hypothetical protein
MPMNLDQMHQQMEDVLGAAPIPEESLISYARLIATLSDTITTTAAGLNPEDQAADFAAFLDSFGDPRIQGKPDGAS